MDTDGEAERDADAAADADLRGAAQAGGAPSPSGTREILSQALVDRWCQEAKEHGSAAALKRLIKVLPAASSPHLFYLPLVAPSSLCSTRHHTSRCSLVAARLCSNAVNCLTRSNASEENLLPTCCLGFLEKSKIEHEGCS